MISNDLLREARHEERVGQTLRPGGLAKAINREFRSRAPKFEEPEPIIVPRPVGQQEALTRTTDMLMRAQAENRLMASTVGTLQEFVSRFESKMLAHSYQRGLPLPREVIRAALTEIYRRGEAQRKERVNA